MKKTTIANAVSAMNVYQIHTLKHTENNTINGRQTATITGIYVLAMLLRNESTNIHVNRI